MVKNSLGREIPEVFNGKNYTPYKDPRSIKPETLQIRRASRMLKRNYSGNSKVVGGLREAIIASGLKDGMTISTHHHLRNGDRLLNDLVKEIDALGLRDIKIASSSVHIVHAELIPYIRKGVITALARIGVDAALRQSLLLVVDEACTNIIRHAYGGPSDALIHLHLEREGDELRFELLDDAPCGQAAALQPRDLADCRPGGLGINFIDSLMDHWSLTPRADGCGNRLWMVKHVTEQGDTR